MTDRLVVVQDFQGRQIAAHNAAMQFECHNRQIGDTSILRNDATFQRYDVIINNELAARFIYWEQEP